LTAFALSGAQGSSQTATPSLTTADSNRACVDLSLPTAQASVDAIKTHVLETTSDKPPELRPYGCNATLESDVKEAWSQIINDFGKVDVLVTAAGIVDNVEAENYDFTRWRKMMDINVDGTWLFAREAGKHMIQNQIKGSIILVASMSATICVRPQKQAAYNASKGAVKMLMKSLSTEWAPYGIRVNAISPGYMYTDLIKGLLEKEGKDKADNWVKDIPMGRSLEKAHRHEYR
jgi:NAD(P)-dependent dehydrogenase (short-subunit alcohol dehydrogenase family)